MSETIAAALCLVSRNRKADEVVVKLTPDEVERVIDIVQHLEASGRRSHLGPFIHAPLDARA